MLRNSIAMAMAVTILWSCAGSDAEPGTDPFEFRRPKNFPQIVYTFDNNPVSKEGFELGRRLFYDPILSSDSSISCASCHQQVRAFADPVHRFSRGVNDAVGFRNAPPLQNLAFHRTFFWDGGVNHLDFVPINAITSEVEMHETIPRVVGKLQRSRSYPALFKAAFGSEQIDSQRALHALSQFMTLMISSNSRYDRYVRGEGEQLTAVEAQGLAVFRSRCSGCHATDLFSDGSFRNNGLDQVFDNDPGRARITETESDIGKFKVPSLRNVELTSPYMHDGRFKTPSEVLHHYAHGVKDSPSLDPLLKQSGSLGIHLSEEEKTAILSFLKTLTDEGFTKDSRFAFPGNH